MKRLSVWLTLVLLLGAGAVGGLLAYGYLSFKAPGPLAAATTAIIPRGTGSEGIAQILHSNGIISNELIFRYGSRFLGQGRPLQAGEYEFPKGVSPEGAMEILQGGKTVVRHFTVPEGLTSHEIVDRLNAADGLTGTILQVPGEGTLLPETYNFSYGDSRTVMLRRMETAMDELLKDLWSKRADGLPFSSAEDAVTLASIVEKETARAAERPHVASVYINRLRTGMKLQSDPTVIYAVTDGRGPLDRALTRDDLERASPFNTYAHTGLPPGPIANPGRASIEAALRPLDAKDLYFVADGTGGHVFAKTLAEHNQNVAKWRALSRPRTDQ